MLIDSKFILKGLNILAQGEALGISKKNKFGL